MEGFTLSTTSSLIHPFSFFPSKTNHSFSPRLTLFVSASKQNDHHSDQLDLKLSPKLSIPKGHQLDDELIEQTPSNTLRRPVPKKGVKFDTTPTPESKRKISIRRSVGDVNSRSSSTSTSSSIAKVILRKPGPAFPEDDIEPYKSSRLTIKSNLLLKMSKEKTEDSFSDITLLKKPQPVSVESDSDPIDKTSSENIGSTSLLASPIRLGRSNELKGSETVSMSSSDETMDTSYDSISQVSEIEEARTIAAALQGKPARLEQPSEENYHLFRVGTVRMINNSDNPQDETVDFTVAAPLQEQEDADWSRAENLFNTGEREEVELISCSSRGFVGSFGSLIGFLPYRNLGAKWKFLAFESWVRQKGLDPSMYKQNLGIIGGYELHNKKFSLDSNVIPEKVEGKLPSDIKLEDLLKLYDQEKTRFLSSFVGQKMKVSVELADRNSRKLMFSGRPKQKEEVVEKKRSLMAKLSVGDVVKCCIKKITYFGIFVEVEGVPALIHQSEVSWDATLDPSSFLKIGQIVEAKVHQLDFSLERIQLSLKEITPDPLIEALESVVGDRNSLDETLEAAHADVEWDEVESLIKQLQQIEDIQSVSKGRFFLSPGLTPTFQVYMASMFENRYKLLARSGNKVQEVIVQASMDKEEMKAAILTCTNRVE